MYIAVGKVRQRETTTLYVLHPKKKKRVKNRSRYWLMESWNVWNLNEMEYFIRRMNENSYFFFSNLKTERCSMRFFRMDVTHSMCHIIKIESFFFYGNSFRITIIMRWNHRKFYRTLICHTLLSKNQNKKIKKNYHLK